MSEEPGRQSHVTAWTLGVLAAVVLYVLSVPWLDCALARINWQNSAAYNAFSAPHEWLAEKSPLAAPLGDYRDWVYSVAGLDITIEFVNPSAK